MFIGSTSFNNLHGILLDNFFPFNLLCGGIIFFMDTKIIVTKKFPTYTKVRTNQNKSKPKFKFNHKT